MLVVAMVEKMDERWVGLIGLAAAAGALPCLDIAVLCGAGVGGLLVEGGEEESFERIVGTYGVSPLSWL